MTYEMNLAQLVNIFVDPFSKESLSLNKTNDKLLFPNGKIVDLCNEIPNFIYPQNLSTCDQYFQDFYEGRAKQYDANLHLTFKTHDLDEEESRRKFIKRLQIKPEHKVLEIACGTGRDSLIISELLSSRGELHLQDFSLDMMSRCKKKFNGKKHLTSFCLSNAMYLPYRKNFFNCIYSFGAFAEFSDPKLAISEMIRVTKPGGRIVFGDECVPYWLRETDYFKILCETNPMFASKLPLKFLPIEARNTSVEFVIGDSFYLISFDVGEGEPSANFDFKIPGLRGGTYNTRYFGKLEGVSPQTKDKVMKVALKKGISMHDWLDKTISEAADSELL